MSRTKDLLHSLLRLDIPLHSDETFPLFPDLPLELRQKIWEYAAHEPRVIILDEKPPSPTATATHTLSSVVQRQTRHPALLQTSRGAREEGLRWYERVLEKPKARRLRSVGPPGFHIPLKQNTLYINFAVDIFLLREPTRASAVPPAPNGAPPSLDKYNLDREILERICNLAMVYTTAAYYRFYSPWDLLKAAPIQSYTAIFPEGFTKGDCIDGELLRIETRRFLTRQLGQDYRAMGFQLIFKWQVREGVDLPPCPASIGGALSGVSKEKGEEQGDQWWKY